ncbi:MAG: asparagine synthase (glutamine-hydrolyzing) [Mangrovimonas sp.]|nr:asparagine synthase (glutamine-hydrolyzing) [Mangrovimonas sp.]MCB0436067.1 asparagine synthase (glutamine-hydrolyzing) [Mangrovimonas sp.]HPF98328.1 asparagine synthase (glutamine-hydrolyzing) [Mangrovimonas sp.]
MCGINGIITTSQHTKASLQSKIVLMNDKIVHRGPDDDGTFLEISNSVNIAMGMRRLAIIDLNSGKQPIYSSDQQHVIVFNGEIYNYRELRNELSALGAQFNTHSDTEVILMGYKFWGVEAFKKLDGMFAFSIYDRTKNKVFIARDFFGEKPLYYMPTADGLVWASELKSVVSTLNSKPPINKIGLNLFFRLTYIPSPYTIYEGIHKLVPNSFLEYDLAHQNYELHQIQEDKRPEKTKVSLEEAKNKVKELVEKSVESRAVSDVPIGTFLSGGVDSSIVSLCLSQVSSNKINTFSIGFDNKAYDETEKSKLVAKQINSDHHEFILTEKDLENNINAILLNFDEPFADSSALPSYLVAHQTSKYLKVALTGDGGDEVFGGYNKYYMGTINKRYTKNVPEFLHKSIVGLALPLLTSKSDKRGMRFKLKKMLQSIDYKKGFYWDIISLGFPGTTLRNYLLPDFWENTPFTFYEEETGISNPETLTDYRYIDKVMSLEGDMLVKVDRTSMLTSLESRAPFLNKSLWQYSSTLPEEYLINKWDKKYILKEAFREQFPEKFFDSPKVGFGVPIGDWLRSSLKDDLLQYIDKVFLERQQIFDVRSITNLIHTHLNGKDHTFMVWSFYCFQKWYSKNIYN